MKLGKEFLEEVSKLNYPKPQTNYDRLISKTPEELAKFITGIDLCELLCGSPLVCDGYWCCEQKMLSWLKSPVEVET